MSAIAPMVAALRAAGQPFFLPSEHKVYVTDQGPEAQWQFSVADPDGYLLRVFQPA